MKQAELVDCRRHINEFKKFNLYIKSVSVVGVEGFDDLTLDFSSAIVSICGRNGVGKTSFLRLIYKVLTKADIDLGVLNDCNINSVSVELVRRGAIHIISGSDSVKTPGVIYFDASSFALKIIDEYVLDEERTGWLNGVDANELSEDHLWWINRVTGKNYSRVFVYEIGHIIDDVVFPYFEVECNGRVYFSQNMGQGEHKTLVLMWKLLSLEKESIFILEEPESFICPISQMRLMDFIFAKSNENKINIILSTHSEHILKDQKISSINVMFSVGQKLKVVSDHFRALSALGLSPEKKNVLLVEDLFAKLVLETILKDKLADYFVRSYIHVLSGESNIQMLAKHYHGAVGLNFVAVYDADQLGQIDKFSPQIPKVFLPSENELPPEKEVISCIKKYSQVLADNLNISPPHKEAFIGLVSEITSDHHDYFIELVAECQSVGVFISLESVKLCAVKVWMDCNNTILERFIFELENVVKEIDFDVLEKQGSAEARCGVVSGTSLTYEIASKYDAFPAGKSKGRLSHCHIAKKFIVELAG